MPIRKLMNTNVVYVNRDTLLSEVAKIMYKNHIGDVVVVDEPVQGERIPMGIITDRDIVMAVGKEGVASMGLTANLAMNKELVTIREDEGLYEAIRKMSENGIRRMPVVDDEDNMVGIICADDILGLLGDEMFNISNIVTTGIDNEIKRFKEEETVD